MVHLLVLAASVASLIIWALADVHARVRNGRIALSVLRVRTHAQDRFVRTLPQLKPSLILWRGEKRAIRWVRADSDLSHEV